MRSPTRSAAVSYAAPRSPPTGASPPEILALRAGDAGEGARFWLQDSPDLQNRGWGNVLIAVCDGLEGLPEAITTMWERTVVQQCIVHLIRISLH
jgi:putative transposase